MHIMCISHVTIPVSYMSNTLSVLQVKEDGDVKYEDAADQYFSPAADEEGLYEQLEGQGIPKLSKNSIE